MAHLEDLPKISLHDHLDGGLRPETVIELANRDGIALPAETPDELADWFVDAANAGSLVEYLKTYKVTLSVMQKPEDLRRIASEYVLDLWDDGVIYGEVRWAPEQHTNRGLTMNAAVQAVQLGIDDAVSEVTREGDEIRIGQILCAMRQEKNSLEVAKLALMYRDVGVVGFDLAGPEDGFGPELHSEALTLIADELFPVTLHAGEAAGLASIRSALVTGHALRLGHGVRLADDLTMHEGDDEELLVSLGPTAQWVRNRGIAIECCPSSNLQTGAAPSDEIEDHPIDLFYRLGMCVTVSTDSRLMTDTTLSHELELLVETFGYTLDDLRQFQLNAARVAFLPLEDREELIDRIEEGFDEYERAMP